MIALDRVYATFAGNAFPAIKPRAPSPTPTGGTASWHTGSGATLYDLADRDSNMRSGGNFLLFLPMCGAICGHIHSNGCRYFPDYPSVSGCEILDSNSPHGNGRRLGGDRTRITQAGDLEYGRPIEELELIIDPDRSSSGLTQWGGTNPQDRIR